METRTKKPVSLDDNGKLLEGNIVTFFDQNTKSPGDMDCYFDLNHIPILVKCPQTLYKTAFDYEIANKLKQAHNFFEEISKYLPIITNSSFLVIRVHHDIEQLIQTTRLMRDYAEKNHIHLPPVILVCRRDQYNELNTRLGSIPITIAGIAKINFEPAQKNDDQLNMFELPKLFHENKDIHAIFKQYQFHNYQHYTEPSITNSLTSFFKSHPRTSLAVGVTAGVTAMGLSYLTVT